MTTNQLDAGLITETAPARRGPARLCCSKYCRIVVKCCCISTLVFICVLSGVLVWYNGYYDSNPLVMDQHLKQWLHHVETDATCTKLTSDLLLYARSQVEMHKEEIQKNLANKKVHTINLMWPGNGYNQVAYGGNYEVIALLHKLGIVDLGYIIGSSGGAASALLALADSNLSSSAMLKYNIVYLVSNEQNDLWQWFRETTLWSAIYRVAVEDEESFKRVSQKGAVACLCGSMVNNQNTVFTNFSTRKQVTQAYYASGDSSMLGFLVGTKIDRASDKYGSCKDGGSVTILPNTASAVLFYHAFYGMITGPVTLKAIDFLFRQGVDETIRLLRTPDFHVPPDGWVTEDIVSWPKGGMMMVVPDASGHVTQAQYEALHEAFPGMEVELESPGDSTFASLS